MQNIFCLVFDGNALTDQIRTLLFAYAQELMRKNGRKKKLNKKKDKLTGEIRTDYKLSMLGSACGFIFSAHVVWDTGTVKTDYIVRPLNQALLDDKMKDLRWIRANADFVKTPEPWRN